MGSRTHLSYNLEKSMTHLSADSGQPSKFTNDAIESMWVFLCVKTIPYPLNTLKKATAGHIKFAAGGQGL